MTGFRRIARIVLGLAVPFLAGCRSSIHGSEIAGLYVLEGGVAGDTLRLGADGDWHRSSVSPNGQRELSRGTWSTRLDQYDDVWVVLERFTPPAVSGIHQSSGSSTVGYQLVRSSRGDVTIDVSRDRGLKYVQAAPEVTSGR